MTEKIKVSNRKLKSLEIKYSDVAREIHFQLAA